ncbi:GGDEF domain-containing protein [Uliginosibacterium sp. H3]|uniref:diguanylate cyclase n=1 Tax=Uliginosibacterium silvisoli TaxID=3114758 RepID=A0ABU6K8I1_9RHOO|nr:GGDEF domain-containing protein [Uliginosibacterium sp. H3]
MNTRLHHFMGWLQHLPRPFMHVLTLALFVAVAGLDYVSGTYLSLSALYCLPVSLAAWRISRNAGITTAVLSAVLIVILNPREVRADLATAVMLWNFIIVACLFTVVAVLVAEIGRLLESERALARTDFLTGARNRMAFMNDVDQEILRALRHGQALSLIYIDLDDFKAINDRLGHREGDRLLQAVSQTLLQTVRGIDAVARLGGDEFVVLLPNADSDAAAIVAPRLREALLNRMLLDLWPVTFSIGVLTCPIPPNSAEQLIHRADELMYRAKQSGKDRLVYSLQSA